VMQDFMTAARQPPFATVSRLWSAPNGLAPE
jgi:hypothetical protein